MNERIKELWWKARIGYNEQNCDPEVLEKFAELIVRECIECSDMVGKNNLASGYPNSTGRYSGTGAAGASIGNIAWIANDNGATLSAVAHNWTMVYTDHEGNTAQTAAALAGISGAIVNRFDHAGFAIPLLSGDLGIADIESIACSVNTVAAGAPTITLAHPLAFVPVLAAAVPFILDGINSAFNLVQVLTDANLAFAELQKSATTATTYAGEVTLVSG